ncbi:MAG: hypothetical protein KC656_06930 [Myxococcales bacterium]|nr:hypothetical protein [Myxococcales bacterium]
MLLVALLACKDACPDDAPVTLELGTGSDAYRPMADGAELTGIMGPQFGWHFELALRGAGFTDDAEVQIVGVQGDEVVLDQLSYGRFRCRAEVLEALDIRMFPQHVLDTSDPDFDWDTWERDVEGPVDLTVTVTDEEGDTAAASTTWDLRSPI